MITPVNAPLTIRRNDNPFRQTFFALGADGAKIDFSAGYSARLEFRLYAGAPGAPLVSASSEATTGPVLEMDEEGITFILPKSQIPILIGAAGADQKVAYDLLVHPTGGDENAWFEGEVTLKLGVAQ